MNVRVSAQAAQSTKTDLLVALLFGDDWEDQVAALNEAMSGKLVPLASGEGFEGKPDQQFSVHTLGQLPASRVLLLGAPTDATTDQIKDLAGRAAKAAGSARCASLAFTGDLSRFGEDVDRTCRLLAEGARIGAYRFDKYLTKDTAGPTLEDVVILTSDSPDLGFAEGVAAGVMLARDLVNEPPDVCTPSHMAKTGEEIADRYGMECEIFGPDKIKAEGMNLFHAVGRGSLEEPRFVHLTYKGSGDIKRRIAYVGKGVTFDTGGYNLKPGGSMMNMHCDMAGGAAVLGAAEAIGRLKPANVEVHFIVPSAVNMVSEGAYTVNEIIEGRGKKTVEINNTDAEGRLLLADSLSFAKDLGVDEIIDLATLTGACVVALGEQYSALYTSDEDLGGRVLTAANETGERFWRMPLDKKLRDKLKSKVADMKNTGDRWGGSITAALFLSEWVGDTAWVHLDIAGPAFVDKDWDQGPAGGTGVGVAALAWHACH